MAGQGTAALELLERGGPARRAARAGRRRRADRRLRDGRPKALRPGHPGDRRRARGGRRHPPLAGGRASGCEIAVPRTIADGQQADVPGELTFAVIRRLVDEVVMVSDAEIVDAMRFAVRPHEDRGRAERRLRAGRAAGRPRGRISGERCGVVLSGGNVGAGSLRVADRRSSIRCRLLRRRGARARARSAGRAARRTRSRTPRTAWRTRCRREPGDRVDLVQHHPLLPA